MPGIDSFLPTLGLHIPLGQRFPSCVCLPAPGQSLLNPLLQALEETSRIALTVTMTPSGRAIHVRCGVTSAVQRLAYPVAILDFGGGRPFAKKSLKLLPGTGVVVRGRWLWQALLKPYPVGTDIVEPS